MDALRRFFVQVVWFSIYDWWGSLWYCVKGYGAESAEEKQRIFKLMRNLNLAGESGSEAYTPTVQSSAGIAASDVFYSPEVRGEFGAGLLDLHAMDDSELLSEVGEHN